MLALTMHCNPLSEFPSRTSKCCKRTKDADNVLVFGHFSVRQGSLLIADDLKGGIMQYINDVFQLLHLRDRKQVHD